MSARAMKLSTNVVIVFPWLPFSLITAILLSNAVCSLLVERYKRIFSAGDLKNRLRFTVVDVKEFFEYKSRVLRADVKPAHLDALTFHIQVVLDRKCLDGKKNFHYQAFLFFWFGSMQ